MTTTSSRRGALRLLAAGAAATAGSIALPALAQGSPLRSGKIFISSNLPEANEVLVFERGAPGLLARLPTDGLGSGAGLGSQGAVTLAGNGRSLFVVNALSNSVSTFIFTRSGLVLRSVVDSQGQTPTSVAEHDGLVYVLNAGGDGNVAAFRNIGGVLAAVPNGVRGLSAAGGTAPAQVGFSRDGTLLVVSERATNLLSSWPVLGNGTLGTRVSTPSPGLTPFGFAVTRRDVLVVSEAAGGAAGGSSVSSYRLGGSAPTPPLLVSPAVATTQTAACWVAVSPDGRFAYACNAGSSSVSSYAVARSGAITLLQAQAAVTGDNTGALDAAFSADGEQLHVFASRGLFIASYAVGDDGSLSPLITAAGMPQGSAGLAAN